jgi:predicted nucleic acid-binding protein
MRILVDTGVLGQICHPRKYADVRAWFVRVADAHDWLVSEVADYELRRELLRIGASRSLAHLDELTRELEYVAVTTSHWRAAAALWATARRAGVLTAPPDGLDGDVLLAAQASSEGAAILTTNARHFSALGVVAKAPFALDEER